MSRFILRADASPAAYERLLDGNVIETKAIEAVIANTGCAIEKLEQEISILERSAACTEEDYKKQLSLYEDIQGERLHIQSAIDRLLEEKHSRLMYMEIESRDKNIALTDKLQKLRYQHSLAIKEASLAADERDAALEAYTSAKEQAKQIKAEQEQICQRLENELADANEGFTNVISEAAAKYSRMVIAREAAEHLVEKATAISEQTTHPIEGFDESIEELTQKLEILANSRTCDEELLDQRDKEMRSANTMRDAARREYEEEKQRMEEAGILASAAERAYISAKEDLSSLSVRLRTMFQVSEQNTYNVTENMEQALTKARLCRDAKEKAEQFFYKTEDMLAEEKSAVNALRQELNRQEALLAEEKTAADMAAQLAEDAAKQNIDQIPEIEQEAIQIRLSLENSACMAKKSCEDRAALVEMLRLAFEKKKERRKALEITVAAANEAKEQRTAECAMADKLLEELSVSTTQWVKDREKMGRKISLTKDEYDNAARELLALRTNMERTAKVFRNSRIAAEQAHWEYNKAVLTAENTALEWDKKLNESAEEEMSEYQNTQIMLAIAKEKRDDMVQLHQETLRDMETARLELFFKTADAAKEENNYLLARAEAEIAVENIHKSINASIDKSKELITQAEIRAEEAGAIYKQALINASAMADSTSHIKEAIDEAQGQFIPLQLEMRSAKQVIEKDYTDRLEELRAKLAEKRALEENALTVLKREEEHSRSKKQIYSVNSHALDNMRHHIDMLKNQKNRLQKERRSIEEEFKQYVADEARLARIQTIADKEKREREAEEARIQKEALQQQIQKDMALAKERVRQEKLRLAQEITSAQEEADRQALELLKADAPDMVIDPNALDTEAVHDRIRRMEKFTAEQIDISRLPLRDAAAADQFERDAYTYRQVAETECELFDTACRTYENSRDQQEKKLQQRKETVRYISGLKAKILAARDRLNDIQVALDRLSSAMSDTDTDLAAAAANISNTAEAEKQNLKKLQMQLHENEHQLKSLDTAIEELQQDMRSAEELRASSLNKWVYNAALSLRMKHSARLIMEGELPLEQEAPRTAEEASPRPTAEKGFFQKRKKLF